MFHWLHFLRVANSACRFSGFCEEQNKKSNTTKQPTTTKGKMFFPMTFWSFLRYFEFSYWKSCTSLLCFFWISSLHLLLLSSYFRPYFFPHLVYSVSLLLLLMFHLSHAVLPSFVCTSPSPGEGYTLATPFLEGDCCHLPRPSLHLPLWRGLCFSAVLCFIAWLIVFSRSSYS